jgi:hypothetical protein
MHHVTSSSHCAPFALHSVTETSSLMAPSLLCNLLSLPVTGLACEVGSYMNVKKSRMSSDRNTSSPWYFPIRGQFTGTRIYFSALSGKQTSEKCPDPDSHSLTVLQHCTPRSVLWTTRTSSGIFVPWLFQTTAGLCWDSKTGSMVKSNVWNRPTSRRFLTDLGQYFGINIGCIKKLGNSSGWLSFLTQ